jgi:hypothetical protein
VVRPDPDAGHPAGFDPYPFILLTLALSLQASYAAPLILLAQNRQAERDREEAESDRRTSVRTQADTEYLARELAGIRLALGEMPTRDYLAEELEDLRAEVQRLRARLEVDGQAGPAAGRTVTLAGGLPPARGRRPHRSSSWLDTIPWCPSMGARCATTAAQPGRRGD